MDISTKASAARQGLFWGTVMLLISNIFVKGLGFFYRVALVRLLGAEGMGLAEMVSPLFSFLLVLAGCGLQTALAQSVASGRGDINLYLRTAALFQALSATVVTLMAWFLAPLLAKSLLPDPRILLCFQAVLPAILIISVASALRGLFQGRRIISAIGMSQNIEQIIRVIVGLYLARRLLPLGLESAVSAVSLATVAAEGCGFAWLLLQFSRMRHTLPPSPRYGLREMLVALRKLLDYGLPLTLARLATSGIAMLQAFLIPICLQQAGWGFEAATEIYGRYSGVAMSLLHLPGVFTAALTVSVLPTVAESMNMELSGRKLLYKRVCEALYATLVFTLPGMLVLVTEAEALCTLIFNNAPAAPILRLLAGGGIFLYLQITLTGILQGLGKVRELLRNNIISGSLLLLGVWLLTPLPALGVQGAALAASVSWLTGFLLNLSCLKRWAHLRLSWRLLAGKPLFALSLSALALAAGRISGLLSGAVDIQSLLLRLSVMGGVYFLALLVVGGLKLRF